MGFELGAVEEDGVEFSTDRAGIYRANLGLRTASRVLVRVGRFRAAHFNQLEQGARAVPWEAYCEPGRPIRLRISTTKSRLYHKRGIEERLRRRLPDTDGPGDAPDTETQLFVVRIFRDRCTISVDTSGDLLHRRGYRLDVGKAPLRETLAAAIVQASGWTPLQSLVDGFCGSGTVAIEAALIAKGIAPGRQRSFIMETWPDFPHAVIESEREAWEARSSPAAKVKIRASDRDAGAVERTRANAERAGVDDVIEVHRATVSELSGIDMGGFLVSNPPYGVRARGGSDLRDLYDRWGAVLRASFAGSVCGVLAPDSSLVRRLGFPFEVVLRTKNGGLPVALYVGRVP